MPGNLSVHTFTFPDFFLTTFHKLKKIEQLLISLLFFFFLAERIDFWKERKRLPLPLPRQLPGSSWAALPASSSPAFQLLFDLPWPEPFLPLSPLSLRGAQAGEAGSALLSQVRDHTRANLPCQTGRTGRMPGVAEGWQPVWKWRCEKRETESAERRGGENAERTEKKKKGKAGKVRSCLAGWVQPLGALRPR